MESPGRQTPYPGSVRLKEVRYGSTGRGDPLEGEGTSRVPTEGGPAHVEWRYVGK